MDICPFSKQPCPHPKIAQATEEFVQLNMCKICFGQYLKKEPINPKKEFADAVIDLIETVFAHKPVPTVPAVPVEKHCVCGCTVKDIIKTGKIGCDQCYKTFYHVLKNTVSQYHNAVQHVGKIPKKQTIKSLNSSLEEQIQALKIKMARAIEIENYEVAGVIKAKIAELQQQISAT